MGNYENQHSNAYSKFFVVNSEKNELKNVSPILIHKTIISVVGEVKSVKKLNSGNLLIEVLNAKQCENMLKLEKIGNIAVKVTPHRTLNHSRGVISESEFQRDLEEDLLDCLKDQKVIAVRRITIKRNNQNFPTKHLILTFNTPVLPKSVKIAYINCPVRHFIPNPLRCFKCQRFGHTITACRGKQICARCSLPDHDSNNCSSTTPKCYNCNGEHPAFSRSCPRYKLEKEIQTVKITKNISFQEARKIVTDRTPKPGLLYSSALNSVVSPSDPSNLQNPRLASTIINTPTVALMNNPPADNELITIKKSEWLSLLAIKKSWDEAASSSSVANTGSSAMKFNSTIESSSSVSETCAIPPVLSIAQATLTCSTVGNTESRPENPIAPVSNSSNVKTTSNKTPSTSNSISSSKSNSSPLKLNVKTNRKIKKQSKKSNELEKAKESKSAKRARILAAKRDQDVSQRSPSRKDFLKDSLQVDNIEDDSDSDSLLKFHPSEDGMSTSEGDDILPSS
ncbi:hypothetical protein AVEN_176756-1 [Araneus ventricosus]|uniref:CCHC-type domain-containing protein n=1 Tax=Araneus ventricosus TaxID=182803 RepID=A0A4Y2QCX0_ARAVE|nr:hypothetical protein AVEN_70657-1 [Araneus ventricosus]GBN60477.1 hypothetical protein AVEN_176756-1 [Araneus ventricosus]